MTVTPLVENGTMRGQRRTTTEQRFWAKVDRSAGPDGCWLWTAATVSGGYGTFWVKEQQRLVRAHRWLYERTVGPIPEGLDLDHLCRNRGCVNPHHLEPVTRSENVRRGLGGMLQPRRTHCPHGHPFDEANTYVGKNGRWFCRACPREKRREKRKKAG